MASPGVAPAWLDKVASVAGALQAPVELFHCVFDPRIARPWRFGSRGPEQDIRTIVGHRRQQLETTADQLRARGIQVRSTVRWDDPPHEGIVRQVLRRKPDLLIAQSVRRGRAARLLLAHTDFRLIETCPCPMLLLKSARPCLKPCVVAADIVIMGAVSRSQPKRFFVGHTAERVLDELDCDVLIVKPPGFRAPVATGSVHRLPKGRERRARP